MITEGLRRPGGEVRRGEGAVVRRGGRAEQAVAARTGDPLGHDFCPLALSDGLKPWDVVERRLDAVAAADLVIAIYNPASRERRHQLAAARDVVLRHRDPGTPVV